MKFILRQVLAAIAALVAANVFAATPKAAEDPTATVISVGTPAPRGHRAPEAKTQGKKTHGAKAAKAGKGKHGTHTKKRNRTGRK